jgi:hypothetical protein
VTIKKKRDQLGPLIARATRRATRVGDSANGAEKKSRFLDFEHFSSGASTGFAIGRVFCVSA